MLVYQRVYGKIEKMFQTTKQLRISSLLRIYIANWWLTYPSKKYESQIGSSSQLLGKA
jgi:hypothetical protein